MELEVLPFGYFVSEELPPDHPKSDKFDYRITNEKQERNIYVTEDGLKQLKRQAERLLEDGSDESGASEFKIN